MSESHVLRSTSELLTSFSDFMSDSNVVTVGCNVLSSILYVVAAVTVICIVATFLWRRHYDKARDPTVNLPLPPGCMGYPLVGETLTLIVKGADYYLSRRQKYGFIYKTHILGQPTVRIMGAKNIKQILMGEHITVESSWPTSTSTLMGPGSLLSSTPDQHRIRKKFLLQALSLNVVARFIPDMQGIVRRHLQEWCGQGQILGFTACRRLAMSVATNVLIGFRVKPDKLQTIIDHFYTFTGNLFSLPWNIPGSGLSRGLKSRDYLISEIKERLLDETSEWSIIDDLKKPDPTTEPLSKQELVDSILELWFAGSDTTSSSSCSTLLALGRDERVLKKIEEELKEYDLLEGGRELNSDLLAKLTYVDHVVKEVLRIYMPVGGGFRKTKKTLEIGGYQIPKGWKVIYSIRDTHQITELFNQKEEFLPERWSEMDEVTRDFGNRFNYIPFGAGARACPGEKFARTFLKVFVVELVRCFRWELKNKNPKIRYLPVTHPVDNLPVTFTLKKHGQ